MAAAAVRPAAGLRASVLHKGSQRASWLSWLGETAGFSLLWGSIAARSWRHGGEAWALLAAEWGAALARILVWNLQNMASDAWAAFGGTNE